MPRTYQSISFAPRRLAVRAGAAATALALFFSAGTVLTVSAEASAVASSFVAAPQAKAMDRVFAKNRKSGKIEANSGTIDEALMGGIKLTDRNDKTKAFDAVSVVQVQWGAVPAAFSDGDTYAKRADWENAVANYQNAASDSDARDAVKAAARVRAIEALIAWGATDAARFADAIAEADRYLADHGTDWQMPKVRALKARVTWLSGDANGARDGYKSLFEAGKAGEDGYDPLAVAEAGLSGAYAALMSSETSTARDLFDAAASAFGSVDSSDPAAMARARAGAEEASLAAAQSYLAKGDFSTAAGEFEGKLGSLETAAGKAAAKLGLGLALAGDGKGLEAQIHLGWVAGLDHTSDDRRASALVGLAQAAMGSAEGASLARASLQRVKDEFGATPAAAKAAEMLAGL